MLPSNRPSSSRGGYTPDELFRIWTKAAVVPGYDPTRYRKDRFGSWIAFDEYGQTSKWGWEVDHIKPVAKGGTDAEANLQPLHWNNNRRKSDN